MPAVTYSSAVSELYTVPREMFVARRTELAKDARNSGDRDLAARIGKLAKPTTAAWFANELARTDPDDVHALVDLGAALRTAHERLDGAEIRSLIQRRAELIRGLMGSVADRADEAVGEAVSRDLADILTTATADEAVARALVAGTLSSAKAFASPPEWPPPSVGPKLIRPKPKPERTSKAQRKTTTESATTARATKSDRSARQRAERAKLREQAQQALKTARAEVKRAEAERAATERSLVKAEATAEAAATEVERLETELSTAERKETQARIAVTSARRSVREATDRAARSWRQVQAAEARLNAYEGS